MSLIRFLLRTSWIVLTLAVITGLLSGGSTAGLIALINTALVRTKPLPIMLVFGFAGLCFVRLTTNATAQALLIYLSQKATFDLRMFLCRQILASPLRQLEEIGTPRLLATLTEDIQSVANTVFIVPFLCINVTIMVCCLLYLCWLSWNVFLVLLGFMVLGIVSYRLPTIKASYLLELGREQQDKLFNHFQAVTEGTKELKLHHQRRRVFLSKKLRSTALAYRNYNVAGMTISAVAASWGQILFFVAIGILLFTQPALQGINTPILSSYVLTLVYLMTPLEYIVSMLPNLSKALVALKKIESLGLSLTTQVAEDDSILPYTPKYSWKRLELVGVTHIYCREREEKSFIMGPIDLTLYAGELVFIVGGNGSGKSTLAKLITGLYIPEHGEILLDGKQITDVNREWYRQQFSALFTDFYLFHDFLGLESPTLEATAINYLAQLQLEHKVKVQNGRLSTTDLSQGQRKRLALLTAYLENRTIYMFDEWASDQDPLFKQIFYTKLLPDLRKRGKTLLVISHDNRYFSMADRIIKLDYGKVEYDGRA